MSSSPAQSNLNTGSQTTPDSQTQASSINPSADETNAQSSLQYGSEPLDQSAPLNTDKPVEKPINPPTAGTEKLQKVLARLGLGSRRQMESVISEGRVSVNGSVATLGDRVDEQADIRIDGRPIKMTSAKDKRRRVIAYYKPEGEVCSAYDPEGRTTVFERLPKLTHDRWVMVGRLDINSTGLLLFTNDGELAHRLMHPSNEVVREYAVRVLGEVTPQIASTLTTGVMLEDGKAKFDDIQAGGGEGVNRWYHVKLSEGRNREVRRLFESQDLKVSRLLRTRYGSYQLPKTLRTGRYVELDKKEIHGLTDLVGLRPKRDSGIKGSAKRKQERHSKKPLRARKERSRQRRK